jgi:membrane protein DedA with SNARE-associated domain
MDHWKFTLYTLAGAALWVSVLSWIGYFIGANQELIERYSKNAVIDILAFSAVLIAVYVMLHRRKRARAAGQITTDDTD